MVVSTREKSKMPLYEYYCQACDKFFELMNVDFVHRDEQKCPSCELKAVRTISRTNFALNGWGWGRDGYSKPKLPSEG